MQTVADLPAGPRGDTVREEETTRLGRIAAGEAVPTETHPEVESEPIVLETRDFCLHYGPKQALFDVNMKMARGKVTALILQTPAGD